MEECHQSRNMPEMRLRTAEASLGRSAGDWARVEKWSKPPTNRGEFEERRSRG